MTTNSIAETLVNKGKTLFDSPRELVKFTGDSQADNLLNDLKNFPHAFVLACVMDRQIKAEKAWLIPYLIAEKLGNFEFETLADLSLADVEKLMTDPAPLHRFPADMSKNFHSAIQTIAKKYDGLASKVWDGEPSSAEVVYRFLEFRGIGQKIGTMAANILARDLKIKFSDYYSIDISVDVHVQRVFYRLGLIPKSASPEQVIYRARALSPAFPGLLDLPAWEIGRSWCKPKEPICSKCYMSKVCPKIM
jgi:endonuclease III